MKRVAEPTPIDHTSFFWSERPHYPHPDQLGGAERTAALNQYIHYHQCFSDLRVKRVAEPTPIDHTSFFWSERPHYPHPDQLGGAEIQSALYRRSRRRPRARTIIACIAISSVLHTTSTRFLRESSWKFSSAAAIYFNLLPCQ